MRVRVLALLSALALWVIAAVPASAASEGHVYLALGDSVPFGFNPLVNPNDAGNFIGYPEKAAQLLDIKDVNASCPGEATGGFLSLTGIDNVCRPYRAAFPLHTEYQVSQMDFVLRYLTGHRDTRLITLTLGANDFFRFLKDHPECAPAPVTTPCLLLFGSVLQTMHSNLDTIFSNIRGTGYKGLIVAVTYYALDYRDETGAAALNGPMIAAASAHGALIADGLAAWRTTALAAGGSSCAAGLLIVTSTSPLTCDVHPTPLGRDLLASAVLNTVAASCPAHDAISCLDLNH